MNLSAKIRNVPPLRSRAGVSSTRKGFLILRWKAVCAVLVVSGSIGLAAVRLAVSKPEIPTGIVRRGEFVDYMQLRGEVKAFKSVTVAAPSGAGDLRIIRLIQNGRRVKQREVLVQFDPSDRKSH